MSEERITSTTGGQKGRKDEQLHHLPWEALAVIAQVYAFGADKYDAYNFRKGYDWSLSFDALQRHLWEWWSGEEADEESELSHLAHAAFHVLTLLLYSKGDEYAQHDDRPVSQMREDTEDIPVAGSVLQGQEDGPQEATVDDRYRYEVTWYDHGLFSRVPFLDGLAFGDYDTAMSFADALEKDPALTDIKVSDRHA